MAGGGSDGNASNSCNQVNQSRPKEGYAAGPPWIFKGRALYQLNLVKADVARRVVPPELKLVEAFGYTLGGVYYAQYDSSPAGKFDELVIIPGIVWDPPASCAWAAAVMVDNATARDHGIKEVGLPSRFVSFNKKLAPASQSASHTTHPHSISSSSPSTPPAAASPSPHSSTSAPSSLAPAPLAASPLQLLSGLLNRRGQHQAQGVGLGVGKSGSREGTVLQVAVCNGGIGGVEEGRGEGGGIRDGAPMFELHMKMPSARELASFSRLPSIKMSLPSFSGRTEAQPALLKYSCDLSCRVRLGPPATTHISPAYAQSSLTIPVDSSKGKITGMKSPDMVVEVLSGRPLVALCFEGMEMRVEAPTKVMLPPTTLPREAKTRDVVFASKGVQLADNGGGGLPVVA
ncbi:hypothetical protein CLOM_g3924 [Closterium sp. NIES-68]|nr:hypothetical protein CLOM_g3924 [Closterium sp. NIES-68]